MRTSLVCLFSMSVALAQSTASIAILSGTITDPDRGAVKAPVVQVTNSATGEMFGTSSSATGEYSLKLPAGTYNLICATASLAIIFSYIFSTCQYSSSTRVERPKIDTLTFNLPRSG